MIVKYPWKNRNYPCTYFSIYEEGVNPPDTILLPGTVHEGQLRFKQEVEHVRKII